MRDAAQYTERVRVNHCMVERASRNSARSETTQTAEQSLDLVSTVDLRGNDLHAQHRTRQRMTTPHDAPLIEDECSSYQRR